MDLSNELDILPVVEDPDKMQMAISKELHENLPDIESGALGLIIAPVKSGKSTIITNLLLNSNFYRDCFDAVHIFSNTIMNDNTSRFLKEQYPDTIHGEYSDATLNKILQYQESFPNKADRPFICIILDDFLGSVSRNSAVYKLSSRYRHYGIGLLLFSSQQYKELHPIVRTNLTFGIFGRNSNKNEKDKISAEMGSAFGSENNFLSMARHVWKTPYAFLHLDFTTNPPTAYDRFKQKIFENGKPLIKMKNVSKTEDADSSDEDDDAELIIGADEN